MSKMKVIKITNGPLKENCYVLTSGKQAIIIDPGTNTESILDYLKKNSLKPMFVLLTHGHFDHIYSAKALSDMGAKIYISEVDAPKLLSSELNMGFMFGFMDTPKVLPDGFLTEGKHKFLNEEFEIIFTPGHTSGSICIIYEDYIFTGDTYFSEGVYGRCDLLDGHSDKLAESLKKLQKYLKGKTVLSGHE